MPTFIAVHKWKPEEHFTAMKEIYNFFTKFSARAREDIEVCSTYMSENGAFCVWNAPSAETLEKLFEGHTPTLKKGTEIVPVVQAVPPTMEYVLALMKNVLDMASRQSKN
jgi:hypothetical protein